MHTEPDTRPLSLQLEIRQWAAILGALWLIARTHPELTDQVGPLAQRLYHAYAEALGLDLHVSSPLLAALPWQWVGDDPATVGTDRG